MIWDIYVGFFFILGILLKLRMSPRKRECRLIWLCSDYWKVSGCIVLSIRKEALHCDICPGEIVLVLAGGGGRLSERVKGLLKPVKSVLSVVTLSLISHLPRPNSSFPLHLLTPRPYLLPSSKSFLSESLSGHFVSVLFFLFSVPSYQIPSVVNSMSCVFLVIVQDS